MKKFVATILYFLTALVLWMAVPSAAHAEGGKDLYCLFNPATGEYLYTVDEKEKASLEGAWYLEGVVCKMPSVSSTATYRLYNPVSGLHLYTADEAEISKLTGEGWTREGVAYYVDDNKTAPVYRLFDPKTGEHAFGSDTTAAKMEQNGWTREGVAFYATWANNELTYTGKKSGKTAAKATVKATGKWYDGFQKGIWYDAGDHFFYICDVDDYETNKKIVFSPEAEAYTEIIKSRYPEMYSRYQFLEAKRAGGVPVVVVDRYDLIDNYYVNERSVFLWQRGSDWDRSTVKADQTFAPYGTDSPWGELYVLHGNGLDAYFYKVLQTNWEEKNYYYFRDLAACHYMDDNLYEAYGGFQKAAETFHYSFVKGVETVGTWNGMTIAKVYWDM
ncbi:MAG: hypothetical protein K6A92_07710 [Lachnospiraceae bacterium]|nr:hypothetical protein [Lachnospiraceae bacterium]